MSTLNGLLVKFMLTVGHVWDLLSLELQTPSIHPCLDSKHALKHPNNPTYDPKNENQMTLIMKNQMKKTMEHEMETRSL